MYTHHAYQPGDHPWDVQQELGYHLLQSTLTQHKGSCMDESDSVAHAWASRSMGIYHDNLNSGICMGVPMILQLSPEPNT